MDARLRFACALAAAGAAGLLAAGAADAATVLRVDPADGSWTQDAPARVRLWFDDATAAQAAQVRVTTPRHGTARPVRTTVNDEVVTVPLPDDGDGTYRVVWFVVDDGTGQAAAGTTSFRVGAEVSEAGGGSGSFTIPDDAPDDPVTTDAQPSGGSAAAGTTSSATASDRTTKPSTPTKASPSTPSGTPSRTPARTSSAPVAAAPSTAGGAGTGPADDAPDASFDAAFDASALVPSGPLLAGGLLAGLLAFAAGARWSLRRGEAAGLR